MCGIVGYIGKNNALPILLDGLSKLEYRGYDSAGVALLSNQKITIEKAKGKLINLKNKLDTSDLYSNIGIGHTRWATHGKPSEVNAHPHSNMDESIVVIHNGIIENYLELAEFLNDDIVLKSETDTEIIAHLIDHFYTGDLLDAVYEATFRMKGAYAFGVISKDHPDTLIAVRKDSPLIIGLGDDENFIASDIPAVLKHTKDVLLLENDEYAIIKTDSVTVLDRFKNEVSRESTHITWDLESVEKGGFEHFTLKEIHEQPTAVRDTILRNNENVLNFSKDDLQKFSNIYIVACGTAYHAGLIAKYIFKNMCNLKVDCEIASEFTHSDPIIDENTLVIAISQSGETLDTLQSIRLAKSKGARILSILNVVGSSIARDSHDIFYTLAGPEIGVASTKVFTSQLTAFYLIALDFAKKIGTLTDAQISEILENLKEIPSKIQEILDNKDAIQKIASTQFNNESIFFIGRNLDAEISYESSLKLKEISYINSFAIAAGELKHGTIALIEDETLVVAIATQDKLYDKMLSNIKEVKARGAHIFAIVKKGAENIDLVSDEVFYIPTTLDILTPLLSVIPTQLFAYYVSLMRGNDVDTPRNLAKSVTVE